jgi:hypothetical protein
LATTKRPRTKKATTELKETPAKETRVKETPVKATASVTKQVASVTTRTVNLQEAIRVRAYELFEQRGFRHGADFDDWLRAEQEIRERFNVNAA